MGTRPSISLIILLGVLCASAQGCDKGGIYPLNAELDVSCTGVKSSWLRTIEETDDSPGGTELFLFTEADPTEVVAAGESRTSCFVRAFIHNDSSTDLEQGTYTVDATGKGVFSVLHTYSMTYEDDSLLLGQRAGARRDDQPSPSSHAITVEADGDQLILGFDGEKRRLTNVYDVARDLDPSTDQGKDDIFRFLNLTIYTSAVRIVGFGSLGMSSYTDTSVFTALVANEYSVGVNDPLGKPKTDLTYSQFEDINGIIFDGVQRTVTNLSGTGDLSGILDWRIRGSDDPDDILLEGTLDYKGVHVKNGVASSGTYTFTVEGEEPALVSYALAADLDLRTVLPPEEP